MRFVILMKANQQSEAGIPDERILADDFGAEFTPEARAQEECLRAELERKNKK